MSDAATEAKAAAERQARYNADHAEEEQAERMVWTLSERERQIVAELNKGAGT